MQAKAIKYSINACVGVAIHASPIAICKTPQSNPDSKLTFKPQRKARMKIGTMAIEIDTDGIGLIEGNKSKTIANAAKNDASINASKPNFFIKKSPLLCISVTSRGE